MKGIAGNVKHFEKCTDNNKLNHTMFEGFVSASAKRMHISRPMIQEPTKKLSKGYIKTCNGGFKCFKHHNNILFNFVRDDVKNVDM